MGAVPVSLPKMVVTGSHALSAGPAWTVDSVVLGESIIISFWPLLPATVLLQQDCQLSAYSCPHL